MSEVSAVPSGDEEHARDGRATGSTDLRSVLDLETIDNDLYRGWNAEHGVPRQTLYGGQVAAQALRAAGHTVPGDRFPHSLHGYFLRPGTPDRPVLYRVDRDRDGRSFSARHVSAIQDGAVIFSMLASFHVDEPSATFDDAPAGSTVRPDDVEPGGWDGLLEIRAVTPHDLAERRVSDTIWVRSRVPLGDDPLVQACALTYISDLGSGFGQRRPPELPPGGPSIDHAIWFQAPIRADEWVLLSLAPAKAGGSRGVYVGSMRDESGALGAFLTQEMLLRPRA
jgi:acyl-CoA thioesterase-2